MAAKNVIKSVISTLQFTGSTKYNIENTDGSYTIVGDTPFKVTTSGKKASFESKNNFNINGGSISMASINIGFSTIFSSSTWFSTSNNTNNPNTLKIGDAEYVAGPPSNCCSVIINNTYYYPKGHSLVTNLPTNASTNSSTSSPSEEQEDGYYLKWTFEEIPSIDRVEMSGATELLTDNQELFKSNLNVRTS